MCETVAAARVNQQLRALGQFHHLVEPDGWPLRCSCGQPGVDGSLREILEHVLEVALGLDVLEVIVAASAIADGESVETAIATGISVKEATEL